MAEIKTVKFDNFEMDYFTFGNGPKVFVIVPGMSLKSVMLSADAIIAAYAPFSSEYTCYVFDYVKDMRRGYSARDMADDLSFALRLLGVEHAYYFGASLGGMVLQELAIRHPEFIDKIALGSTFARVNDDTLGIMNRWKTYIEQRDVVALNRDMRTHIYSEEYLDQWSDAFAAIEADATDEELERAYRELCACLSFNSYQDLGKIKCPVLVIGSNCDKALQPSSSIELATALGCELYMYDGYSHAVYDEAPDYKDRLLKFFDE